MTLKDIVANRQYIVKSIDSEDVSMLSRVIALGMFPGETVSLLNTAPLGDPLQLKAGETYISMRKKDAQLVQVQPL